MMSVKAGNYFIVDKSLVRLFVCRIDFSAHSSMHAIDILQYANMVDVFSTSVPRVCDEWGLQVVDECNIKGYRKVLLLGDYDDQHGA